MNRLLTSIVLAAVISQCFTGNAFAQPPQEELDQLLVELGWEMADLTGYLDYYELSLTDFETTEDLRMLLGTPITPENLNALLTDYGMTKQELDVLLAEFGETVEQDYHFIEDLEIAIDFYQNHDGIMKEYEDFLTTIGVTEEEADNIFNHFTALDQLELEAQMEQLGARLENLLMIDPEAEITEEQKAEVIAVWEEIIGIAQLNPQFSLVDSAGNRNPISFAELADMEDFPANALLVELFNLQGTRILDLQVSEEMLGSQFAINAGEKLTDIGDLAGEYTELMHEKLPNTASPYIANLLFGIIIILTGVGLLAYKNKRIMN